MALKAPVSRSWVLRRRGIGAPVGRGDRSVNWSSSVSLHKVMVAPGTIFSVRNKISLFTEAV